MASSSEKLYNRQLQNDVGRHLLGQKRIRVFAVRDFPSGCGKIAKLLEGNHTKAKTTMSEEVTKPLIEATNPKVPEDVGHDANRKTPSKALGTATTRMPKYLHEHVIPDATKFEGSRIRIVQENVLRAEDVHYPSSSKTIPTTEKPVPQNLYDRKLQNDVVRHPLGHERIIRAFAVRDFPSGCGETAKIMEGNHMAGKVTMSVEVPKPLIETPIPKVPEDVGHDTNGKTPSKALGTATTRMQKYLHDVIPDATKSGGSGIRIVKENVLRAEDVHYPSSSKTIPKTEKPVLQNHRSASLIAFTSGKRVPCKRNFPPGCGTPHSHVIEKERDKLSLSQEPENKCNWEVAAGHNGINFYGDDVRKMSEELHIGMRYDDKCTTEGSTGGNGNFYADDARQMSKKLATEKRPEVNSTWEGTICGNCNIGGDNIKQISKKITLKSCLRLSLAGKPQ